jgi:hypothetical protein
LSGRMNNLLVLTSFPISSSGQPGFKKNKDY